MTPISAALLCLSAVILACDAGRPFPGSLQEKALFRKWRENRANFTAEYRANLKAARAGVSECIKVKLAPGDTISQKFYDDHICQVKTTYPKETAEFCRKFCPSQPLYQVMIVTKWELGNLRADITSHHGHFVKSSSHYPPVKSPPSSWHFFTDDTYTFYECKQSGGTWTIKKLSNHRQQYIPKGTYGNVHSTYQIYHGCPPVKNPPTPVTGQFGFPGSC